MNQVRKAFALLVLLLVLPVQNVAIFQRHYFQGFVFPDDFLLTYHAIPSYWIQALSRGKDIDWIPVQAIGYPLYMSLQSGYGYLPLRALAWIGMPYTLHTAVVLQGLHVLLGAAGAMVCARLLGLAWRHALVAGVLYQCFGGFYSNAQHPDIVRSFAFLPWLCGPVLADWRQRSRLLLLCTALLPVWGYAQFTGGYPGAAIASTLLLGGLTVARLVVQPSVRQTGFAVLAMQVAGPLLAGWVLAPAALDASLIDRASELGELKYDYMQVRDLVALSFPVDGKFFGHDLSMRSMFLAIPGLVLLAAAARRIRELSPWPLWCAVLALLAAMGPLHQLLAAIIPPAGLSRFVMADYRGFVVLGMILAGVQGLALLATAGSNWRVWPLAAAGLLLGGVQLLDLARPYAREDGVAQLLLGGLALACCLPVPRWRSDFRISAATIAGLVAVWGYQKYMGFVVPAAGGAVTWVLVGGVAAALTWIPEKTREILPPDTLLAGLLASLLTVYQFTVARPDRNGQVVTLCVVAAATLLLVNDVRNRRLALAAVAVLALLTVADWKRVTWDQRYFAPPVEDGLPWLEASIGSMDVARRELDARLQAQACRPARVDPPENAGPARWAGYYTGEPHMRDHGIKLTPVQAILRTAGLSAFAQQPWRMVEVPRTAPEPGAEPLARMGTAASATCMWAGTATARYRIDASSAQRLVENEMFWAGWSARLTCLERCAPGSVMTLQPSSTSGFRTWDVPAGSWQMDLRFETPHRAAGWAATGAGLAIWMLVGLLLVRGTGFKAGRGTPGD